MKQIELNGVLIEYKIAFKKNKNTYFYFQKDGSIQINASKYQSEQDLINYMKKNATSFLQKREKAFQNKLVDDGLYYYLGIPFRKEYHNQKNVLKDDRNQVIYIPSKEVDHNGSIIRKFEREALLKEVLQVIEKYRNNPYVNIRGIVVKTRHTKSRFGSCNSVRRTINLNANLIHYDRQYLEYVFAHEISHLKVQNHSKAFYDVLEKLYPNYREVRKELRKSYR
jgi:predicted metal-dependent hydrolase